MTEMSTSSYPVRVFSIVGSPYVPERHFEIPCHDADNRRRRKEYLSVLAGSPCIDRGDAVPGISERPDEDH
jgi:hypothetical protein